MIVFIIMLQFRQIQAFHTIMDTGTVTRAAKRLGISQPGVSNLIANLEHEQLDVVDIADVLKTKFNELHSARAQNVIDS